MIDFTEFSTAKKSTQIRKISFSDTEQKNLLEADIKQKLKTYGLKYGL